MSLLDKTNLLITPNAVKASKLYSVIPENGNGDLTVVRNTTATRVNSSGLIESVAANVPRLNYDTVGGAPSILLEPQRTNLLLNTATLANQSITTTAAIHTLSFRGTGTVTLSGSFSGSLVGTGTNNKVTLTFTPTAATLTLTISGSCTNGQIELGGFATSYIPTTSAAVTRNADLISKTGISDLINSQDCTFFLDAVIKSTELQRVGLFGSNNDNRFFLNVSGQNITVFIFTQGVTRYQFTFTFTNILLRHKILVKWKSNEIKTFIDGTLVNSQSSFTTFQANILNQLAINNGGNAFGLIGLLNSIQVYNESLTDAECTTLTTL